MNDVETNKLNRFQKLQTQNLLKGFTSSNMSDLDKAIIHRLRQELEHAKKATAEAEDRAAKATGRVDGLKDETFGLRTKNVVLNREIQETRK